MAGNSSKKQAQSNLDVLNKLYKIAIPLVLLAFLRSFVSSGENRWIRLLFLHAPLFGCLYVLDKSGRPTYTLDLNSGKKKLVKEGMDLSQEGGLTAYMFDIIYLSLISDVGKILLNTNKLFYLSFVVVPIYIAYKLYGLKQQYFGGGAGAKTSTGTPNVDTKQDADAKSKRQMKREKRGEKPQVKYR